MAKAIYVTSFRLFVCMYVCLLICYPLIFGGFLMIFPSFHNQCLSYFSDWLYLTRGLWWNQFLRPRSKVKVTVPRKPKSCKSIFLRQFYSNLHQTLGKYHKYCHTQSIRFWERSGTNGGIQVRNCWIVRGFLKWPWLHLNRPYRVIYHFEAIKIPYSDLP